jgi:hypothetical protein
MKLLSVDVNGSGKEAISIKLDREIGRHQHYIFNSKARLGSGGMISLADTVYLRDFLQTL